MKAKTTAVPKRLEALARRIESALAQASRLDPGSPKVLVEAVRYCLFSNGKRYRPLLCLGACQAVGGSIAHALPAACAIELVHTYSLVHDDLPAMDDAAERRGQPSCHKKFGEGTAILVGDALLTRAFELLGRNGIPNALAVVRTLGEAGGTAGLIGGQVLDLDKNGTRPGLRQLENIARRKTAALITASVVSGGLVGRAAPKALARLQTYGECVGLAFQMIDDLHDRDGLARVMKPDAVRRQALSLITRGKRAVAVFGRRAATLETLADWLARSAS